jgi:hypothetical protein
MFCQNSGWQSNNQSFTAIVYWIKFLIFPVSTHLPFNTSVYKLQWYLTLVYRKSFRKISNPLKIFISYNLSCICNHSYYCYFLAMAK